MSPKALALDQLNISSSADKLKLTVSAEADIDYAGNLTSLDHDRITTAFKSGNIWVSRGVGCRVEIRISVDAERSRIVECLGSHLRNAPLWSQLSLSPRLEIPQSEWPGILEPDILLHIRHEMPTPRSKDNIGALLMGSSDIQVPESVLCAQLGKLELHFDFRAIDKTFKKAKLATTHAELPEVMLLDDMAPPSGQVQHLEALENAVSTLSCSLASSITTCFANTKTTTLDQGPLLLGMVDPDDNDMLLSQTDKASSLTYESSLLSIPSSVPLIVPLKRPSSGDSVTFSSDGHSSVLEVDAACRLSEIALRIIIGSYGKGIRGMGGVQVKKPSPSTCLSEIIPSLWSPGFKESMNHNARFLPTISEAISSPWPCHIQSPLLRRKLMLLADSVPSIYHDEADTPGSRGSTERLGAVVQARLWAMMQRKLYDPLAARRLRSTPDLSDERIKNDGEDCEDLLRDISGNFAEHTSIGDEMVMDLAEFMDEGFAMDDEKGSMFDDLLGELEDDYDLLGDYEQMERKAVEQQTDEMLLLDDYSAEGIRLEEQEIGEMLLEGCFEEGVCNSGLSSDNETMLL